ncbi:metal ABC transporter substrate-binding protein [Streptomyces sp. NPDC060194]|uniref:metal ABC transporter substrate-binding protein n=1 Tax=Streptomyces sp. NPDC060194 TaxID=3347069 RepID=UPI0036507CA6
MNVRRRHLIPAAAATLSLLGVSACSTASGSASGGSDGRLAVTASFYPLQFLAEQIGGENARVTTLTEPGQEPHDLEISPRQTGELGESDLALYVKGLQPAVDEAIDQSGVENAVDAGELTTLETAAQEEHSHEGEEGHDHAEGEEHAEEGHSHAGDEAHSADDGHDHGPTDPHFWLDPVRYAEVAEGVGKAMAKADPDHAAAYGKNTDALVAKLKALDTEFDEGLANTDTRTFITTHSAFGYLAARYGLEQESIAGVDPENEPSPARMRQLQEIAGHDGVTTVFFETLASDKTAKTLASDTGLRTDVLDPVEGITDGSKGDDYFGVMRANLAALQKALGAK